MEKLEGERLKELIKRAEEEGTWESYFLLKLSTYYYNGSLGIEVSDYKVVLGEVDQIVLESRVDGSRANATSETILIIPKTIPVIILYRAYSDIEGHSYDHRTLYVFTKDGWKSITIY